VEALTTVKTHFKDFSCSELFSQISKEKVFLEKVHKSDKYSCESGFCRVRPTFYFCMNFFKCHVSKLLIFN
jgi:hypothetical protein